MHCTHDSFYHFNLITVFISGPLISNIPFFAFCSDSTQQIIVSLLNARIFLDGDIVVTCGEIGKEMFVIERGTVQVSGVSVCVCFVSGLCLFCVLCDLCVMS